MPRATSPGVDQWTPSFDRCTCSVLDPLPNSAVEVTSQVPWTQSYETIASLTATGAAGGVPACSMG
jgi:hypothetical protein